MTLTLQEASIEAGQPIELYKFSNLESAFHYTSSQSDVVFGGATYVPAAISRTSTTKMGVDSRATLVVKMPITDPFPKRYVFGLPASPDKATVYRQHSTDGATPETIIIFDGQVENVGFTGNEAKINIVSTSSLLSKPIPRQTMRGLCNHVLFDSRCKVIESQFSLVVEVTSISVDGLIVGLSAGTGVIAHNSQTLDDALIADPAFFDAGVVSRGSLEQRSILSTTSTGGNNVQVSFLVGFQTLSVGDSVKLFAGCSHSFTKCRAQFANGANFGGFPYVPQKNPFVVGVEK